VIDAGFGFAVPEGQDPKPVAQVLAGLQHSPIKQVAAEQGFVAGNGSRFVAHGKESHVAGAEQHCESWHTPG